MTQADETWLTQEAFDRLNEELTERSSSRRTDITNKIAAAREEGDLKENGGYHAAKDEQGKNEARIRQLRQMLENAKIGTPPDATEGKASQGTVVTVQFPDGGTETFLLGSREEAATATIDVYSPTSPLGSAVLNNFEGSEVTYELPNGRSMTVAITKVEPYTH
ncbi:MAG: transcription elongation factor GreA [Actinomycetes bacterium]